MTTTEQTTRETSHPSLEEIRKQFPALGQTMRGKHLVYLDNGATSLKPERVIDAELSYYRENSSNIHRGVYQLSEEATAAYDAARSEVASFVNAAADHEIIFTRGTTEGINLVGYAWGRNELGPGDEIVTSELEHHSNLVVWQQVAKATGAILRFLPLRDDSSGVADGAIEETIGERTRLVAITGMSNVTGYRPPLKQIIERAHRYGALVLVDGAQLVAHGPVDVQELDIDFLAWSGHKMCGPTGIGALYAKESILEAMEPFHFGGDMIERVWKDSSTWAPLPEKFEAGTPNIAGAIGMGEAVRFLREVGPDRVAEQEADLIHYTLERAAEHEDIIVYGGNEVAAGKDGGAATSAGAASGAQAHTMRGGIFSFNLADIHSHDVGMILDSEGVAVRAGFHCAQPLMRRFGIPGTTRASFYLYNTREDVDALFTALDKVRGIFG